MIDITPQMLQKFTDEEIRIGEQSGWVNSNNGAYPCMSRRDKGNYDSIIYKTYNSFILDIIDEQTFEKTQKIHKSLRTLLKNNT